MHASGPFAEEATLVPVLGKKTPGESGAFVGSHRREKQFRRTTFGGVIILAGELSLLVEKGLIRVALLQHRPVRLRAAARQAFIRFPMLVLAKGFEDLRRPEV
ncbi:hypothetical protein D3C73_893860 [compost metagenome]